MLPSHLPEPDLYRSGAGEPSLRWGIVGPGWIAGQFADAVRTHTTQRVVAVSILARTPMTATIAGSEATISIDGAFFTPTSFTLHDRDFFGPSLFWTDPTGRALFDGLSWEATALARFVGEGRLESPVHTLDETISILATIDEARAQIGKAS